MQVFFNGPSEGGIGLSRTLLYPLVQFEGKDFVLLRMTFLAENLI